MIYLDYSATTPVNKEVLDSFVKTNIDFIGNSNSLHNLGSNINELIRKSTLQIEEVLQLKDKEIIYTSGASESNNLAIKGICLNYQNRGKHIITTKYEHSSVISPIKYLESLGYEVSYVETDNYGVVKLDSLKSLIRDDTILVSINAVNSEIGILQPINEIGIILKKYPKCFYHVDLTQAIGKVNINFDNLDLASFSAHKIYGLKGIGGLIKNKNINLLPLIHGGKSTTIYRSGTPAHPLIVSLSKTIRLSYEKIEEKYNIVDKLNKRLVEELSKYAKVAINSNKYCIPHILNISVNGIKAETFMHALEKYNIYVSTKTACSDENAISESVYDLTHDYNKAKSSIRISISHLTTEQEINEFLKYFDICYKRLT